jgi:2-polyprenyl-3-methyl-5-hydroxy-6-metoxy-1,4-benzoquinol methylase
MPIDKCRVCGAAFFDGPLLRYEGMPAGAQAFPDADSLEGDKGVDLEVCQCSACGLVQLNGEPVSYYRDVIRSAAVSPEMKEFRERQFRGFVERFGLQGKKVIEIGCGRGEYLSIIHQCGVRAYGVEHLKSSVEQCTAAGLAVACGFVEGGDYRLDDAPFDAFFILNFLEHLPRPTATLAGIANLLAPEAVGLVEVPNFDMVLRTKLFAEFIADHLFYFTKETLSTTLRLGGFEVLDCTEVWHDYMISAIVKKMGKGDRHLLCEAGHQPEAGRGPFRQKVPVPFSREERGPLDLSLFREQMTQLRAGIESYLRRFAAGRVAVWGASHQALALVALLGLAKKIEYVVDSAPFKQGKFTPATHVPIVSPETLDTTPVDAVIVMAASYSDEVGRILRQRFGGNLAVAILRDFGLEEV